MILAVNVVQLNVVAFVAFAVGVVVFCVMVVFAVAVQPFAAVTNNVYVPGWFTVAFELAAPDVIPGPDHAYVPPPVPVKLAVNVVQLNVLALVAVIVGAVVFWVTAVLAVAVQPLAAVTIKLYAPGKLTIGVAVAPPAVIPGPDHE